MHACYCQRCASIVVMLIFTEVSERIDQEQNYLQKISLCFAGFLMWVFPFSYYESITYS